MLGEIINKDVKRLKCSAFSLHILGTIFKMVELRRSKGFKFPVEKKKKVYYPHQGKEYPQRKWFYCASKKFQERDIIKAPKG